MLTIYNMQIKSFEFYNQHVKLFYMWYRRNKLHCHNGAIVNAFQLFFSENSLHEFKHLSTKYVFLNLEKLWAATMTVLLGTIKSNKVNYHHILKYLLNFLKCQTNGHGYCMRLLNNLEQNKKCHLCFK